MHRFRYLRILCGLLGPLPSLGTSYAPPERREIPSDNGKFLLILNPAAGFQEIHDAAGSGASLWRFRAAVWHQPFVVSDDGTTVAEVAWQHVQEKALEDGNCVTFHRADGASVGIRFSEVFPDPPKTSDVGIGPIGGEWRTWYSDVDSTGDALTVHTTDGGTAVFSLARGALVERRSPASAKSSGGEPTATLVALVVGALVTAITAGTVVLRIKRSRTRRRARPVGGSS